MTKADEHDCCAKTRLGWPCVRYGRYGYKGKWYCRQHHPDTVRKKYSRHLRESLRDKLEALAIECAENADPQWPRLGGRTLETIGRELAELRETGA